MEVFRPAARRQRVVGSDEVSILVLMEVFRPAKAKASGLSSSCFNPCSDGSVSTGISDFEVRDVPVSFNPCSDGSVSTGVRVSMICGSLEKSFNPCSDGSVSTGKPASNTQGRAMWCFNPCSDGSVSTGIAAVLGPAGIRGFNPCSDGSVSTGGSDAAAAGGLSE